MIGDRLIQDAQSLFDLAKARRLRIVTAESCTGGLISASLTAVPGSSVVVERGFVTYSNEAKVEMLGVPAELIERRKVKHFGVYTLVRFRRADARSVAA